MPAPRPWLGSDGARPPGISPAAPTAREMARAACERRADQPLLHYFGTALPWGLVAAVRRVLHA